MTPIEHAARAVMWAALAAAVIVIVLLPVVPWANYGAYLDVLRTRGDKTAIHIINQSLTAFLERFGYPAAQFLNWTGQDAVTVALPIRVLNAVAAAWASPPRRVPCAISHLHLLMILPHNALQHVATILVAGFHTGTLTHQWTLPASSRQWKAGADHSA